MTPKRWLLALSILLSSGFCISTQAEEQVVLSKGTAVSIVLQQTMDSQKNTLPLCVIAADIYDAQGKKVLIRKGTNADVQAIIRPATAFGDAGRIIFQPISTTAYNGRLVVFDTQQITFDGNEDSIVRKRKQVTIAAGTSFRAYIANDLVFTIDQ